MYEEDFKSTKPFQRCLVSSTLQKYCENKGKTTVFPQLPRKTHVFGKNRAFLGKNKKPTRSAGKNKEKSQNINKRKENTPILLQAFSHTFPEKLLFLGKIRGFLGKSGALLGKMLNEIKITSKREKKELNLLHKNIKNALKMLYTF